MAYAITYRNGSTLTLLADNSVDTTRSVTFIGKDYKGYGIYQNQNLVTLLTNSASPDYSRPSNPLLGELWYDTTNKRLNIFDPSYESNSGWLHAGGASVSLGLPGGIAVGDWWYDLSKNVLNLYLKSGLVSVPTYPRLTPTGWITPTNTVLDNNSPGQPQQVTLLQNYGSVVGALSNTSFIASSNDSAYTFPLANSVAYPILQGLNIIGYVQATGGIVANSVADSFPSNSLGIPGQLAASPSYLFVCTGNSVWKRITLTSY